MGESRASAIRQTCQILPDRRLGLIAAPPHSEISRWRLISSTNRLGIGPKRPPTTIWPGPRRTALPPRLPALVVDHLLEWSTPTRAIWRREHCLVRGIAERQ